MTSLRDFLTDLVKEAQQIPLDLEGQIKSGDLRDARVIKEELEQKLVQEYLEYIINRLIK